MSIEPGRLKIDEKVVEEAHLCPADNKCLDNPNTICPVKFPLTEDLLFVTKDPDKKCNYYIPFGYGGFCNCPVRKKIYQEYNR